MAERPDAESGFAVRLDNFDGPFDLLLTLVSRHELDVTEISLSAVTTEFVAYVRALDEAGQLEQASQFIVIAATLLDMKVASLLPRGEAVDDEDIAALEARDLLFARLLQYRAFKQVSAWFATHLESERLRVPRTAGAAAEIDLTPPELVWTTSLDDFAVIARLALAPKTPPTIGLAHLHAPAVSIREQAAVLVARLRATGQATFQELIADADSRGVIVARFLAVLELYREAAITYEQIEPLGPLSVRWTGQHWSDDQLAALGADYDQ
ncbi:MAG: segregation and condensation protein A [Pseudoclavibacter sp.]